MKNYKVLNIVILLLVGLFTMLSIHFGIVCIIISSLLLILWTILFVQKKLR